MKHKKQMEELKAASEASIKELLHLQNEKGAFDNIQEIV